MEIVAEVLKTEAVLISSKTCKHPDIVKLIKKRIEGYITATNYMLIQYNVSRKLLQEAIMVTPGKRAPTISTLDGADGMDKLHKIFNCYIICDYFILFVLFSTAYNL